MKMIQAGDPAKKRSKPLMEKLLDTLFLVVPIVELFVLFVLLVDDTCGPELLLRIFLSCLILFCGGTIARGGLCRYCHHYHALRKVPGSDVHLGTSFQETERSVYDKGQAHTVYQSGRFSDTYYTTERVEHGTIQRDHYRYTLQCRYCQSLFTDRYTQSVTRWRA